MVDVCVALDLLLPLLSNTIYETGATSKHGVAGLTRAAAVEYGKHNIRVNAVCPGPIRTPMLGRLMQLTKGGEQSFVRSEPLRRLGEPEEIGETVAWLCSDRASY